MKNTASVTVRQIKAALAAVGYEPGEDGYFYGNKSRFEVFVFDHDARAEVRAQLEAAAAWLNERDLTNRAKFPGLKDPYVTVSGRTVELHWA